MGAPWSSRISEIRRCPFRAAQWRGVSSSFKRQSKRESPRGTHQKLLERGQPVASFQLQGHIESLRIGSREQSGLRLPLRAALEAGRPFPAGHREPTSRGGAPAGSTPSPGLTMQLAGTHLGPCFYLGPTVQQEPHHDHVPPAGGDVQWRDAVLEGGTDCQDVHPLRGEGQLPRTPHPRVPTPRQAASLSPLLDSSRLRKISKPLRTGQHRGSSPQAGQAGSPGKSTTWPATS